jgi:hypothetical protein
VLSELRGRGWLAGVAIVLIYLGTLNALAAMSATTCNNGDASNLWGGFISLGLYGLGVGGLMIAPPGRLVFATLIPAVIGIACMAGSRSACCPPTCTAGRPAAS